MPRTMYQTCKKILEVAKQKGFEKEIHYQELKQIIRVIAGSSPATFQRYKVELIEAGFLETEGGLNFKILEKEDEGFI